MKRLKVTLVALALFVAALLNSAFSDQPHMDAALRHLREARAELQRASWNKGGHRVRAIELVDEAIREVHEGEAAAD